MDNLSNPGDRFKVDIIFENDQAIVINKPAGISMHAKNINDKSETIHSIFRSKLAQNDAIRGGIVHRLDKDTSGAVVLAKTTKELDFLQSQFSDRLVDKTYLALVWGHLKHPRARIELPIKRSTKSPNKMSIHSQGKMGISEYTVIKEYKLFSLLEINIHTGRTHQIRVQLAHMGHPVVGDRLYSEKSVPDGLKRQFLHSKTLALKINPDEDRKIFEAPLAEDLSDFLRALDG